MTLWRRRARRPCSSLPAHEQKCRTPARGTSTSVMPAAAKCVEWSWRWVAGSCGGPFSRRARRRMLARLPQPLVPTCRGPAAAGAPPGGRPYVVPRFDQPAACFEPSCAATVEEADEPGGVQVVGGATEVTSSTCPAGRRRPGRSCRRCGHFDRSPNVENLLWRLSSMAVLLVGPNPVSPSRELAQ